MDSPNRSMFVAWFIIAMEYMYKPKSTDFSSFRFILPYFFYFYGSSSFSHNKINIFINDSI